MKERRITQDESAAKIGRTRQTVCQYMNGDSEAGYEVLSKIADFFSVPTDYLLGISPARSRSADEAYKQGWKDAYKRGWEDARDFIRGNLVGALETDLNCPLRESK